MSDNKHGECCGCPALMADGRLFTQWEPKRSFNMRLLRSLNASDSESLRYMLQKNPGLANIDKLDDDSIRCKSDKFFTDSSNFHQMMNQAILSEKSNGVMNLVLHDLAPK